MNLFAVLGACATTFAAGFGTVRLIGLRQQQSNLLADFAFSWILGAGVVSLLVWIFGFWFKDALLPALVAIFCLLLPLLAWKLSADRILSFPSFGKSSKIDILLGAILFFEIVLMFYLSYVHTLGTDGILNWEMKARYAYANGGVLPASYLQDTGRAFSHPEYPLGIPNTEMWLYFWLGDTNQFWAKTIFGIFYATGAILLVVIGAKLTARTTPGLIAATLLFFVPQMSVDGGSAVVGYVDFPLSVFYLATIGSLLVACRCQDNRWFGIYAACLAFLPWIKQEGAVLWLIAALCGAFVIVRQRKSVASFLALIPGALILLGWRFYLAFMHSVSSPDLLPLNFATARANLHRLGPIAARFLSELVNTQIWSLFWILALIAAVIFVCRYRNLVTLILFVAIAAPITIYAFCYVFSAWPDYLAHMGLSISRLFMHVAPLALLMIAIAAMESWARPDRSAAS